MTHNKSLRLSVTIAIDLFKTKASIPQNFFKRNDAPATLV